MIHVMGSPEGTDEMRAPDEFVCTTAAPFDASRHEATVVFHSESRKVGEAFVCASCGEWSGDKPEGTA